MRDNADGGKIEAERLYRDVLPFLVFAMHSIDSFLVYGKRMLGKRTGIQDVETRPPFTPPTDLGLSIVERYARILGPLASMAPAKSGSGSRLQYDAARTS